MAAITAEKSNSEKSNSEKPAPAKPEASKGLELSDKNGRTIVSSEVIADIAGLAIREVRGVHQLVPFGTGQSLSAFANRIRGNDMKDLGVNVEVGEVEAAIDCRIIVEYGASIPDIASQIRKALNKRVKEMTGLVVKECNIEVVDLYFEEPASVEKPKELPAPPDEPRVR